MRHKTWSLLVLLCRELYGPKRLHFPNMHSFSHFAQDNKISRGWFSCSQILLEDRASNIHLRMSHNSHYVWVFLRWIPSVDPTLSKNQTRKPWEVLKVISHKPHRYSPSLFSKLLQQDFQGLILIRSNLTEESDWNIMGNQPKWCETNPINGAEWAPTRVPQWSHKGPTNQETQIQVTTRFPGAGSRALKSYECQHAIVHHAG